MSAVKTVHTEQFNHENKTWIRLLEFFKQENYFMKTRLAEVVDDSVDKDMLVQAEQFQNKFILKDEYIDELRHDVNKQDKILQETTAEPVNDRFLKTHDKLRNEIAYFEKDFNKLKNEFNKYLSGNL